MENFMSKNTKHFFSISVATFSLLIASGCGQKVNGSYNLSQSGSQFSNSTNGAACSQINLNLTSNSSQVSATGSNTCFTETLTGVDSGNGVITGATLTLIPVPQTQNSYSYYSGSSTTGCIYTGTLTIANNVVTGTLQPSQQCMYYGPITINGTKLN